MNFVDKIAKQIKEADLPLQHLTIVLPSQRMKKYLTAALFRAYQRPLIAPEIVTIDQWVKDISRLTVIDRTRALIQLYQIYRESGGSEKASESFDEFLAWGEILLSDFNEIDRYLVNAKDIFKNLADIKEIEEWSFGADELSDGQKRFMEFWDRLPGYYFELNKRLEEKGLCYSGRAVRSIAENINLAFEKDSDRRFIFAGFNALSPAETSIIKQINRMGRGEPLIDADEYYYSDVQHEAGVFLRKQMEDLEIGKPSFLENEMLSKELDIDIIECAQNTGQVKVASTLLSQMSPEELDNTLLLLADESLIISMIRNLPKSIERANITLGLPIRNTAIRTWVDLIIAIQENKTRFNTAAIYHVNLQSLLNHPFIEAYLDEEEKTLVRNEEDNIYRYNKIFINASSLKVGPQLSEIMDLITRDWKNDWVEALKCIRKLNSIIFGGLEKEFAFEKAIIEGFDKGLIEFENILAEGIPALNMRSFKHLFNQHWHNGNIAYHGNPLSGLQLMGMLETRGLDFNNIICLGMNEGKLPPTNPVQTLIPMDLRRYFNLPTPREKQGIFAHHFYRLLHRAEKVTITYCSAEQAIGVTEPSRYLLQIEKELSRMNKGIRLHKKIYNIDLKKKKMHLSIEKTPEILDRLDTMFAGSASATLLGKYFNCPLDFYFQYVMDFGEEQSVEEEVEHSTFGIFVHGVLEELYEPFAIFDKDGNKQSVKNLTSFDVEQMIRNYELILHRKFLEYFKDEKTFKTGKNLLSYRMASHMIKQFLKAEIKFLSEQQEDVYIESLEREYRSQVEIPVAGETKKVTLRGYIDRIDRIGDKIRIVDYKTGKVDKTNVTFLSARTENNIERSLRERKHVLQLIQYAFMYHDAHGILAEPSIISFVSGKFKPFTLNAATLTLDELVNQFPKLLSGMLEEIYDVNVPFEHKAQYYSYCKYCE